MSSTSKFDVFILGPRGVSEFPLVGRDGTTIREIARDDGIVGRFVFGVVVLCR